MQRIAQLFLPPRCYLLLSLILLPLMISNDSLWLDEGDTAMYAREPDLSAWTQRLLHDGQADCQMPLAMFCAWAGGKVLGTQEWQLRAVNLIWGALAVLALYRVGRKLQLPWLPLLLALQPYFWFYQNEARPYASQLAGGAWLLVALVEFIESRAAGTTWAWLLAASAIFLLATTLLAPLTVGMVVLVGALLAWRQGWRVERKAIAILFGGGLACVPLAMYYASTLLRGAKGAQMWAVDFKFVLYVFYELTGMGGIGLSSLEIRSLARSPQLAHELAARWPQLVLPVLLGVLLVAVLVFGLRRSWRSENRNWLLGIAAVPLLTAMVFVAGSLVLHKAFWARHYAPVFPFYVAVLGLAFAGLAAAPGRLARCLPVALVGLLIYSALSFRFAPSLRKEDYRSAVRFAQAALAKGQTVWWVAGGYSAAYYGLPVSSDQPVPGKAFGPLFFRTDLTVLPAPAVIVMSKPDVHDNNGQVRKLIADKDFVPATTYQSFIIWTNPAP